MDSQKITEKIIKDTGSIRIQGLLRKRKETFEEFLIKFFEKWNSEKDTIFVETKETQTEPGKRRSIGDIYMIAKYYYPKTTLQEVSDILYRVVLDKVPRFRSSYCSTINKRVFYKGKENQNSLVYDETTPDEFGLTVKDWKK